MFLFYDNHLSLRVPDFYYLIINREIKVTSLEQVDEQ